MMNRRLLRQACLVLFTSVLTGVAGEDYFEVPEQYLVELPQITMSKKLGDSFTIEIPSPKGNGDITYVITKPNGDNFDDHNSHKENEINEMDNGGVEGNLLSNMRNEGTKNEDGRALSCEINEFKNITNKGKRKIVLGPLTEEDFGNWLVSTFYDEKGSMIEVYRVYSINIEETVNTYPTSLNLQVGTDLKFSLQRKIPNLQSCQLVAPPTAFDRAFDRDPERKAYCGFVVKKVGVEDEGTWSIIALGNIVYTGQLYVKVRDFKDDNLIS